MIAVVQRVRSASVRIGDEVVGEIGSGLCVLAAILKGDDAAALRWTAAKIVSLRVFPNARLAYDRDVKEIGGGLLLVSNFTIAATTQQGRRPGFSEAMSPDEARPMFEQFVECVRTTGVHVATGRFGADMIVSIENDGPLTLIVRSPASPADRA